MNQGIKGFDETFFGSWIRDAEGIEFAIAPEIQLPYNRGHGLVFSNSFAIGVCGASLEHRRACVGGCSRVRQRRASRAATARYRGVHAPQINRHATHGQTGQPGRYADESSCHQGSC